MRFYMEVEIRNGLLYARLPLIGELCWTKLDGWHHSRPSRRAAQGA